MTQDHLDKLIAAQGVKFVQVTDIYRSCYYDAGNATHGGAVTVEAPGAVDAKSYWATLHELGHTANSAANPDWPQQQFMVYDANCLRHEAAAWRWALDHSECDVDEDALWVIRLSLGSYLKHHRAGALDDPMAADFVAICAEYNVLEGT